MTHPIANTRRAPIYLLSFSCFFFLLILTLQSQAQDTKAKIKKQFPKFSVSALQDTLISSSEYLAEDEPDSALVLATLAYEMGKSEKDLHRMSLSARRIAEAHFYLNEYQKAIEYYYKSADAEYAKVKDSNSFVAERLTDVAYCYNELGLSEKALGINKTALRIQQKTGNKSEESVILNNLGTNYFMLAQYDLAIQSYSKVLEMEKATGDSSAIGIAYNNLGMVYGRWGKHDKALELYQKALNYTTNEIKRSIRYSNIGMCWYHLGSYDKALSYLKQALEIDIKNKQAIKIGIRKNEIALIMAAKGDIKEAIRLNEEALLVFTEAGIRESKVITLIDLGDLYQKVGDDNKAEDCYLKSVNLAKELKALQHIARNYKSLSELTEKRNDHKQALKYYKLFTAASDSIFNTKMHEQIARYEILFETDKKEQQNKLLIKDNELKRRKQFYAMVVIISLVLIILLVFIVFRIKTKNLVQSKKLLLQEQELSQLELEKRDTENRMLEDRVFAEQQLNRLEREKHQAEIDHKNTELANSTLCLVNKNEILGEIKEKLQSTQKTDSLHEVVQFINANTDIDQDWKKFKLTFEEVHPGFFDRMEQQFPQLTDHDLRLSSYLRINLSSREIAGLMNVSLDATNKGRQRLRKKLELEAEADLPSFFSSI
ncbi:MAG: tetratricopeptide repeat protein [Bacteroidales bacterium]|nr:tetratricopeptide repeat protein [Bacteroidales bacterium]